MQNRVPFGAAKVKVVRLESWLFAADFYMVCVCCVFWEGPSRPSPAAKLITELSHLKLMHIRTAHAQGGYTAKKPGDETYCSSHAMALCKMRGILGRRIGPCPSF